MKTKQLLSVLTLAALLPLAAWADVWQDPETKVNYEYTVGKSEASVIGISEATSSVTILGNFSVDGNEYIVTSIKDFAFAEYKFLSNVNILEGMKRIGYGAFENCTGLTKVSFPSSLKEIETYAFHNCSSLTNALFPSSLKEIGSSAFANCTSLTNITIEDGVSEIWNEAFYKCTSLNNINIPESVIKIGHRAFEGTSWYNRQTNGPLYLSNWLIGYKGGEPKGTFEIKEGTKRIAEQAFEYYADLTSVIFPSSLISIGDWAFSYCRGILSATLPSNLTSIGKGAFCGCSSLNQLSIPSSVKKIGEGAFEDTGWYNNQGYGLLYLDNWLLDDRDVSGDIEIKSGTKAIACGAFDSNYYLTSILIPSSVIIICDDAFRYCQKLTEITIPSSVTSIGCYAFGNCYGLTSITIPSSVSRIDDAAFWYCKFENVTSLIKEPFEIDKSVFSSGLYFTSATLYVPKGTKANYEATAGWKEFNTIVEIEVSDQPKGDVNGDQTIDVADIASVISVMAEGSAGDPPASADVNGDGTVDVADIATIISVMAAQARQQDR